MAAAPEQVQNWQWLPAAVSTLGGLLLIIGRGTCRPAWPTSCWACRQPCAGRSGPSSGLLRRAHQRVDLLVLTMWQMIFRGGALLLMMAGFRLARVDADLLMLTCSSVASIALCWWLWGWILPAACRPGRPTCRYTLGTPVVTPDPVVAPPSS